MKNNLVEKIRTAESTFSLILGIVVVVIVGVLFFNYFKGLSSKSKNIADNLTPTQSEENKENPTSGNGEENPATKGELPTKYKIKNGDSLWKISVQFYGTGYNWVDIAKENNLKNPGILFADVELTIPNVQPKNPTIAKKVLPATGTGSISGGTYTVQKGDSLWKISVRAYQDGFKWTQIAKANNIPNPDKIEIGTVLTLPR